MAKKFTEIRDKAQFIRYQKERAGNTAEVVGDCLEDIVNALEEISQEGGGESGESKFRIDAEQTPPLLLIDKGEDTFYTTVEKLIKPKVVTIDTTVKNSTSTSVNFLLSCATTGAEIYYTANGDDPVVKGAKYSSGVLISVDRTKAESTFTIKAVAKKAGKYGDTSVFNVTTRRKLATPTITATGDEYSTSRKVKIVCTDTAGVDISYTLNGNAPTALSTKYSSEFSILDTKTVKAIASASGWVESDIASESYTVGTLLMYYGVVSTPPTDPTTLTSIKAKAFPVTTPSLSGTGRVCFAYNKLLLSVKSIKDQNNTTYYTSTGGGQFTQTTSSDGKYYIYTMNNSSNQDGMQYKFEQ